MCLYVNASERGLHVHSNWERVGVVRVCTHVLGGRVCLELRD